MADPELRILVNPLDALGRLADDEACPDIASNVGSDWIGANPNSMGLPPGGNPAARYGGGAGSGARSGWTWPQDVQVLSARLASKASMAARRSRSMSIALIVSRWSSPSQRSQNQRSDS